MLASTVVLGAVAACRDDHPAAPPGLVPGSANLSVSGAYGRANPVEFRSLVGENRCMDVQGASRDAGARLTIWECLNAPQQTFAWYSTGEIKVYDGTADVKCVDNAGGNAQPGDAVIIWDCHGGAPQKWEPTEDGSGIRLVGTGLCIDVPNGDPVLGNELILWHCHGGTPQQWNAPGPSSASGCGASFTTITAETDSLMAQYGIPPQADTVAVCETYLAGDYRLSFQTTGTSENALPDFADNTETVKYDAGAITGHAADGSPVEAPIEAGPTVFDFMYADQATRDAAQDDPYYGMRSPESSGCADPKQVVCDPGAGYSLSPSYSVTPSGATSTAAADTGAGNKKFTKYGLKRKGVRALVNDKEEIGRSPEGHRRFQKQTGEETLVITLDAKTELLVGEETTGPKGTLKAKHAWAKVKGGYVRERTDIEETELIGGKEYRNRATIQYRNVRVE